MVMKQLFVGVTPLMLYVTEALAEIGQEPEDHGSANEGSKYKQIFRLRELHLLAFFILIYVGIEVTLGGNCSP